MQSSPPPFQPPMMPISPPPAAPASKNGCKWVALGCGLPLGILFLLIVVLLVIGSLAGPKTPTKIASNTTTANAPQKGDKGGSPFDTQVTTYMGKWQGADGTSIWIRADGKGDYDGGNTKVTGGGVTIDGAARTLAITSFFGLGKTWNVTQPPKQMGDHMEMTLDGVVYRRTDGGNTTSNAPVTKANIPASAEQDRLVKATLLAFDQALGARDFTAFYNSCAYAWKEQTSPADLKDIFKVFLVKKIRLTSTLSGLKPIYAPAHIENTGILRLQGFYPSRPARTYFKLGYLNEDGTWKLCSIEINVGKPIR